MTIDTAALPSLVQLPAQPDMPDPLIMNDGTRVTTPTQWTLRRVEIKRILEYYAVGHMPPPPGNVQGQVKSSQTVLDGKARFLQVHLTFGPHEALGFDVAVFTPAGAGPFPAIVHPSFTPTPDASSAATAAQSFADIIGRGYAVLTYDYQTTATDTPDTRKSGFFPAYPQYDWGAGGAWAWGMSRCADYLETQTWVDTAKIMAIGHSRLGKATLIAGAFDERFALVAPAGAGCYGTSAYRYCGKGRGGKEGLEEYAARFPYQIGPHLAQFSGHVDRLPFDQHWMLALVAPRAFFAADASGDPYCNENALEHSYRGAQPVYALLGVPNKIGMHIRPGGHALTAEDWAVILDFAEARLPQTRP